MNETRLFITGTQRLFRESLVNTVAREDGIQVSGEADSGLSTIDSVACLAPDILILETALPDMNGMEVVRQIISQNPKIKIIALSKTANPEFVWGMINLGISGYLLRSCPLKELITAVRIVAKGEIYLSAAVAGSVVKNILDQKVANPIFSILSNREREVLQLIAEGYKPQAIAQKLFISPKTVQTHQSNLKKKLKLNNTAELTKYAVSKGITTLNFIIKGRPATK
ncbi:MAG: response regulator transcription factor [Desulfobacter sp.]|nr:response regulator transcription factor [Desulfobacter sp.]WDP86832.1 MAG: response regulator transcription factor [Desulfobacter sp.]